MENNKMHVHNPIIDISDPIVIDESVKSLQYSEIILQSQDNINTPSQNISFNINSQNSIFLPSKSYLRFNGRLTKLDGTPYDAGDNSTLINNAMMYLFSNVKYKLGATEIESITCPGQTTSILGYLSYPDDFSTSSGLSYCWSKDTTNNASSSKYIDVTQAQAAAGFTPRENPNYNQGFATRKALIFSSNPIGTFEFIVPLTHILGFAGYDKIIYGAQHQLILIRGGDNQAIFRTADAAAGKVTLSKISWHIPEVQLDPIYDGALMEKINNKEVFPINFMARTCETTNVPQARTFDWRLQVTGGVEKPRYIIFGFQTDRDNSQTKNTATFDNLKFTNGYIKLNTIRYPKDDLAINFDVNEYATLYYNFEHFKEEFYGFNSLIGGSQVNFAAFKNLFPIIVYDVRRQDERIKQSVVDLQAKFYFNENVPADTIAYAVILSDRFYDLSSDGTATTIVSY